MDQGFPKLRLKGIPSVGVDASADVKARVAELSKLAANDNEERLAQHEADAVQSAERELPQEIPAEPTEKVEKEAEAEAAQEPETAQSYGPELPAQSAGDFSKELEALHENQNLDNEAYVQKLGLLRDRVRSQIDMRRKGSAEEEQQMAQVRARLGLSPKSLEESQDIKDLRTLSRNLRDTIGLEKSNPSAVLEQAAPEQAPVSAPQIEEVVPEKAAEEIQTKTVEGETVAQSPESLMQSTKEMEEGLRIFTSEIGRRGGNWQNPSMDTFMTRETSESFQKTAASLAEMIQHPETASPEDMVTHMNQLAETFAQMGNMKKGGSIVDTPESLRRLQHGISKLGKGIRELKAYYPDRADVGESADKLSSIAEKRWNYLGTLRKAVEGYLRA